MKQTTTKESEMQAQTTIKATIKRTENPNNYPGADEFEFFAASEQELEGHVQLLHERYPAGSVKFEVTSREELPKIETVKALFPGLGL